MSNFIERLRKLSPKQLLLLAVDQQERLEAAQRALREPIAVIGIGCRLPGGADSPEQFWRLLQQGRDATRDVPDDRWNAEALFDGDPDAPGRMSTRAGGFLDNVSAFDAGFFGVAPREALSMDPQQRLLLEVAWEALEHAGVAADQLTGSSASVFVGACNSEHFLRLLDRGADAIDAYLASGNAPSILSGRVAYCLGFQGPTLTVDTACSSSLVALHLACRSLRSGETGLALACGVNVMSSPITSIALSKAHMLAPDGRCKAFDASADGFGRGEGCGVLVLKRHSDAVAAGDNILALIRGTAINQDGRSGGLTVPNGPSQEAVIRAALADADVGPSDIDYVEAHGTGTSLGDPIEARALSRALGAGRAEQEPLLIGSVKTNIGHLEGAAGIAGVIKVVLSLQHERIPPHLHFQRPSPHIPWSEYRLAVTGTERAWPREGQERMAGVSSFGFSGTNAHVVVQGAAAPRPPLRPEHQTTRCLPLSARSDAALADLAARYAAAMSERPGLALPDVAHTAGAGRSHFPHRLAVVADDTGMAAEALRAFASQRPHPALSTGVAAQGQSRDIVFLFAGHSACAGVGRPLYDASAAYRTAIDECDRLLGPDGAGRTLKAVLWPAIDADTALDEPGWRHAAAFAAQYAAAQLWRSLGVEPAVVVGDADGEYAAACVAGVLSLHDGLRLITERAPRTPPDTDETPPADLLMSAPRIPVAWSRSGPGAPSWQTAPVPGYWNEPPGQPVGFVDRIVGLHREGHRIFLDTSPNGLSLATARRHLPDDQDLILATAPAGPRDLSDTLAQLYVHGLNLNWAEANREGRKVALPTYPFERRDYWHPPLTLQTNAGAGAATTQSRRHEADELYYQVTWQQMARFQPATASFADPTDFAPIMRDAFVTLAARHELSIYDRLLPELDRLCAEYAAQALRRLGFDASPGRHFVVDAEAARLSIAPRHLRLFGRLLAILEEDGFVRGAEDGFDIVNPLPDGDPDRLCDAALSNFGEVDAELRTLRRCARELPRVLTGEQDPLDLLFPGGSFTEAQKLYIDSPYARTFNAALARGLGSAIERLPARATLRILEIGAGTGGTTSYVLPMLPPDRTEYTFTDMSRLFLERASNQYSHYKFLRTAVLNIEQDPSEQGFGPGQFDIVIAANVLHATADLAQTLRHVRDLMAPGGLLFLLEAFEHQRWASLTFGLTDGWWRFTDLALRQNSPVIPATAWRRLLAATGFADVETIPDAANEALAERMHGLIIARLPFASQHWMLVGDSAEGLADALASRLIARGDTVSLARSETVEVDPGANLIYLDATGLASLADHATSAARCASLACERPLQWLAELSRNKKMGRAWLITQGAQAVAGKASHDARWQAPLWGVGRTFALEHRDQWGGLIDLESHGDPGVSADLLLAEIDASGDEDQVAYRGGDRYVARLVATSPPATLPKRLRPDATYLVTGGFGGLGLLVARWMATEGARHIALLGRHPDPTCDAVRDIEALGARVISLAGDVADPAAMADLLSRLAVEAPPLRGVVHAAADMTTAPIDQLLAEQIDRMLRPKIAGTLVLERLTEHFDLDFMVLFSTTTSLLGAASLAHYAAANCFLDATAQGANRAGRRVLSINWGLWERMRAASAETQDWYRKLGLQPLPAEDALRALARLIAGEEAQTMVARVDWQRYKPLIEVRRAKPFLASVGNTAAPKAAGKEQPGRDEGVERPDQGQGESLAARLAATPADMQRDVLENFVQREAAAVLGLDGDEFIARDVGFFDLGMDSLMAVEFRRRLEHGTLQSLPSTLTFNYPTVQALAGFLAHALVGSVSGSTAAAPPLGPATTDTGADLAELDEDELEARLLARLDAMR